MTTEFESGARQTESWMEQQEGDRSEMKLKGWAAAAAPLLLETERSEVDGVPLVDEAIAADVMARSRTAVGAFVALQA